MTGGRRRQIDRMGQSRSPKVFGGRNLMLLACRHYSLAVPGFGLLPLKRQAFESLMLFSAR